MDAEQAEVIRFWFADALESPHCALRRSAVWFGSNPDLDAQCERFRATYESARRGELERWQETAEGALALVLLLDQFSRNLCRGTSAAFDCDPLALSVAKRTLAADLDRELAPLYRVFLYLPFEHCEELAEQQRSVELYEALEAEVPAEWKPVFTGSVHFAREHRDVVARFGRFPHRNAALGRPDTEEERAYLAASAARVGP